MSELAAATAPPPLVPPLLLAAVLACVAGAAAIADCALLAALLRRSTTGLFFIIIQLALADIAFLSTTIGPELWSLNARTWHFGSGSCAAFQGFNVFTLTLSTYLVIAMALHSLTTIRLEKRSLEQRLKRKGRDEDEEIRSSQHSLVANSDSSTPPRSMNVDYRVADTGVSVTLPTVFVWILALSLSIPEFILAAIVNRGKNVSICILDFSHQYNIQMMLAFFNLLLPLFMMSTTGALIIVKLGGKARQRLPGADNCDESIAAVKLSLWLMCVHVILCTPRAVIKAYSAYNTSSENSKIEYSLPDDTVVLTNLILSSAYLIALLIRPLLCIISLPQLKTVFSFRAKISESA